jgi:hypothetical protein
MLSASLGGAFDSFDAAGTDFNIQFQWTLPTSWANSKSKHARLISTAQRGAYEVRVLSKVSTDQLSSRRSKVAKPIGNAGGQAKIVLDL